MLVSEFQAGGLPACLPGPSLVGSTPQPRPPAHAKSSSSPPALGR